ncbi:hypothetical protein Pint_13857 [Pistacia integerrima]|uniref:Uncharacterized protein n=1 Tax=Pistacia integerrima TaxID=434235 RepID=A0ACC0Y9W6_9ROSI|nr:hypothetical protein Pint_13857 [Pistacia integerrima]
MIFHLWIVMLSMPSFVKPWYDPDKGTIKQLLAHVKFSLIKERVVDSAAYRKKKGKSKEGEPDDNISKQSS